MRWVLVDSLMAVPIVASFAVQTVIETVSSVCPLISGPVNICSTHLFSSRHSQNVALQSRKIKFSKHLKTMERNICLILNW